MFQIPDYTNVSLALSEVLAELGLNDVIVSKRRRTRLVNETMLSVSLRIVGRNVSVYMFGSQSEGTTTRELISDLDTVVCVNDVNVISEWKDWKYCDFNLLIVEDEATPPGYCMLQVLRPDDPVPETELISEYCCKERQGRILLKQTLSMMTIPEGLERHGPAFAFQGVNGLRARDTVGALTCASRLLVVQHWLSQLQRPWPSEDMKRHIASCSCFLVPVGIGGSAYETLEWRISTSLGERCLMFSLNITQLQVYVLMKMLLNKAINYNVPEESHISSFMCKTVVLHCVQNTAPNIWQSHMLIECWLFSLFTLFVCVINEHCPHFIIRSNNLMAGKFTQQSKYQLQQNLRWLFDDIMSRGLLSLQIDDVADRLMRKLNTDIFGIAGRADNKDYPIICYVLGLNCAEQTQTSVQIVLKMLTENILSRPIALLRQAVQHLEHFYGDGNSIERSACRLLIPYFYTTLGSLLASESIQSSSIISDEAFAFFIKGLKSDAASSRLKLASAFFCEGDMVGAELILRYLERRYDVNVFSSVCMCSKTFGNTVVLKRVRAWSLASDESEVPEMTSTCVIFTQSEKNCIPHELQYEMYRSTREDLQHRTFKEFWMDWAVVDSLPYLHFLCYKLYGRLQSRADQQRALYDIFVAIQTDPDLGHRETALNLLGQCMEQENMWNYALQYYIQSLNIRPRNNAAKFHICRLLYMRYRQCHA